MPKRNRKLRSDHNAVTRTTIPRANGGKKKLVHNNTPEDTWQERIHLALEAAQMGVWEWDLKTNSAIWSDNIHLIFGLQRDEFDGTFETYLNLIHQADKTAVLQRLKKLIDSKGSCGCEHRLIWPDGTIHWIEITGKVSCGKNSRPSRITGTIQDITKRKTIEFDLEDWKRRHELISSSAGVVIYDYDIPSGNIIWSGNSREVLGYSPRELGNIDNWASLIHPKDRKEAFTLLESAQNKLAVYDVYYRFKKKTGNYIYIHDRGFFIPDGHGRAIRMLGMMSDVTQRIRAEKTILENNHFRQRIENAMPGILYIFDVVNKSLVYANQTIASYLGYSLAELKKSGNHFIHRVIHPDDMDKLNQWSNEPDGTVKEAEQRLLRRDGVYRCFLTRDTPFKRDRNGKITQVIGIAQDITIRKEVVNQLNLSEESYRELFDTVGEAIFIQRSDETIIDINHGAIDMYGYSKDELRGITPSFFSAPGKNNLEEFTRKFRLAFEGQPQTFEFWGKRKNDEEFLVEVRLTKGNYFGQDIIISTARDITERVNAENALRESEQRFRTLQEASFGGIGLHDHGKIIDCNQGLCALTGYSYKELIGSNGLTLIAPEWRDFVFEKIKSGYEQTYDVEGIRKDGTRYFLEIHGKNIPYQGRMIRVTEFRDITERKKAESQIVEQNRKLVSVSQELMKKNEQLEEFTQIVSHNLRAPAGNIMTLLNFYENATSEKEREEYFRFLKESSAMTLAMLNDVNDVLKIKQNKNIDKQELKFETVLQQVTSMLNAKITYHDANVTAEFSEPSITYPGIYLESIMLNLLDNALKYAHPERKPDIRFKTYSNRNGQILMEVSDNGLGLNLDKYGHQIFKLRKTFHRHPESRGIGLFMIKNQIEAMGGDITLSSKENEGSVFFINFHKHQ